MHHYEYMVYLRDLYVACQFILLQLVFRHTKLYHMVAVKQYVLHHITVHVYSYDAAICWSIM